MKLVKINIKNFKNINNLNVNVGEKGLKISGKNGSGKTTIADAFFWTLTGKNYSGQTDGKGGFKVQNVKNPKDVECEVVFDNVIYKKTLSLKGKLGYFINNVEVSATDYANNISENVCPDVMLFSNPNYFASLSWQDQRELISRLNPVDYEDLSKDTQLINELKTKDVEIWRKSVKRQIESDKFEIQRFNSEIEQIKNLIPDLSKINDVERHVKNLDAQISDLQKEIITASNDKDMAKLAEMRANIQSFLSKNKITLQIKESELKDVENDLRNKLGDNQREIDDLNRQINDCQKNLTELREKFQKRASEMYPDDTDVIKCPLNKEHSCADLVLAEIVKNNKRDLIAQFYEQKERDLNEIEQNGKQNNVKIQELQEQIKIANENRENFSRDLNVKIDSLKLEINKKKDSLNSEYSKMLADADKFEHLIKNSNFTSKIESLRCEIAEAQQVRDELIKDLAKKDLAERYKNEIEVKNNQLNDAKLKLELDMQHLNDGEQLIDDIAMETEKRVNDIFDFCQFQMFETLKNGNRQNTCQILINGVPYGRGANRASEVNAGIEICDVFQCFTKIELPIFIDNAESLNFINQRNHQVICLYVSDEDLTINEIQ